MTMTREKKTSIYILIILCICSLLAGCATKKKVMETETITQQENISKVEQEKDTTIIETHDTTKVSQQLVPVEVEIPATNKERVTNDTTSVLETDLYKSTATWSNGVLTHTLEAKPGAKVKGLTAVTNTTKISTKSEKSKKTRNSSTDLKSTQQEDKTTTKQASWGAWLAAGIIIGTAATIVAIIWQWRKRKQAKA